MYFKLLVPDGRKGKSLRRLFQIEVDIPGKAAGNAKIGIAITKHITAAARKPIHHAPTHTLLFGVKPILNKYRLQLANILNYIELIIIYRTHTATD